MTDLPKKELIKKYQLNFLDKMQLLCTALLSCLWSTTVTFLEGHLFH